MNDYSDLLFLIGAIAIYALLVNNTNNAMLRNNQLLTTTEMDYGAVSVAQNVIEKARWMKYGDVTPQKLKDTNDNPIYDVDVTTSDTTISKSEKNNKLIKILVTRKTSDGKSDTHVEMSYIKTDR